MTLSPRLQIRMASSPGWDGLLLGTFPVLSAELTLALALALALFWSKYLATSVCPARAAMCNGVSTFCKNNKIIELLTHAGVAKVNAC